MLVGRYAGPGANLAAGCGLVQLCRPRADEYQARRENG